MLNLASARTTWRGYAFTRRTARALKWVEDRASVGPLQVAQGGFNAGGVSASAGTHDKDSVDLRTKHLSSSQKERLERRMRQAGFAAWLRPAGPSWGEHLHAIPAGYPRDISGGAQSQVLSYDAGRDGLAGNRKDPHPYRPAPRVRFSWLQNKPVPR